MTGELRSLSKISLNLFNFLFKSDWLAKKILKKKLNALKVCKSLKKQNLMSIIYRLGSWCKSAKVVKIRTSVLARVNFDYYLIITEFRI